MFASKIVKSFGRNSVTAGKRFMGDHHAPAYVPANAVDAAIRKLLPQDYHVSKINRLFNLVNCF